MRIAYLTTTCCGDPEAFGQTTPSRVTPHKERANLLVNDILPRVTDEPFDEIWVGGRVHDDVKEAFPDVNYLHVPPTRRDRSEALRIREAMTRHTTSDLLVYAADDHKPKEGFVDGLKKLASEDWDILTPRRYHGKTGQQMADGEGHYNSYSPLHLHVVRRWVWAKVPWTAIDTQYIDVHLSAIWREVGAKFAWTDEIQSIDVEAKEGEL